MDDHTNGAGTDPQNPQEHRGPVEISALRARTGLAGFLLSRRWPDSVEEWGEFLLMAVRIAAAPGMLAQSTVFRVREELPDEPLPGAVGIVIAEGCVVGAGAVVPAGAGATLPPGLVVLHPPGQLPVSRMPSEVASGCVLLPGLPHLGLDHRAAWAASDYSGTISQMRTRAHLDPSSDVDTAVLAMLLAA